MKLKKKLKGKATEQNKIRKAVKAKVMSKVASYSKGGNIEYNEGGKIKGQAKTTQAAQDDKARRVEEGSVIRKKDYDLSTKAGQEAFKRDQAEARANRRQQKADQLAATKAANATGDTQVKKETRKDNKATNQDRADRTIKDAKKVSEADKKKDTEKTTFVVGKGGVKVKKSTATKKAQTTGAKAKEIEEKKKKAVKVAKTNRKNLLNG